MSNRHKAAEVLINSLSEEDRHYVYDLCCGRPYTCDRPNHAEPVNDDITSGLQRVRVEQYGPGYSGDSYWGKLFVRIGMVWVCIPFSM
jgi:hypothetical protein